jgi:iron complex outermembrane receptor protein
MGFSFKNIAFTGYFLNEGNGDHFGFIGSLPPPHSDISFRFKNYGGQFISGIDLSDKLHVDIRLGFFQHRFSSALTFEQPPGFLGSFPDGISTAPFYQENRLDGELDFTYGRWKNNIIKFGLAFANTDIDKVWHEKNNVPSTNIPLSSVYRFTGSENWLSENRERKLFNLTFQDEIKISDSFSLIAGLRYDRYSDVGSELSPRIAAVWQITREHILKTQYARAFCPPTFNQLYAKNNPYLVGNPGIEPETIDTLELSYIYHTDDTIGKAAYFYSNLDDLISAGAGTYSNTGSTRIYGVEFELEHQLISKLKLDSNVSLSHSKNSITGDAIPGVAEWLVDIGIIFEPGRDIAISVQYGYVGKRNRAVEDTRDKLAGYHTVDTAVSLYNCFVKGLTLRAGIKNILDEDVYYASPAFLYPEDYPRPGREWWTKFVYEF